MKQTYKELDKPTREKLIDNIFSWKKNLNGHWKARRLCLEKENKILKKAEKFNHYKLN